MRWHYIAYIIKTYLKPIERRISGLTGIRGLFEEPSSAFEYRVQTKEGIRICSPLNPQVQDVNDDPPGQIPSSQDRAATGRYGVQLVCEKLMRLGYACIQRPNNLLE